MAPVYQQKNPLKKELFKNNEEKIRNLM